MFLIPRFVQIDSINKEPNPVIDTTQKPNPIDYIKLQERNIQVSTLPNYHTHILQVDPAEQTRILFLIPGRQIKPCLLIDC